MGENWWRTAEAELQTINFNWDQAIWLAKDRQRRVLLVPYVPVGVQRIAYDKKWEIRNVKPTCFFANGSITVIARYICPSGIIAVNKHTIFAGVSIRFDWSPVCKSIIRTISPNKQIFMSSVRQTDPSAVEANSCHETRDKNILFAVSDIDEF